MILSAIPVRRPREDPARQIVPLRKTALRFIAEFRIMERKDPPDHLFLEDPAAFSENGEKDGGPDNGCEDNACDKEEHRRNSIGKEKENGGPGHGANYGCDEGSGAGFAEGLRFFFGKKLLQGRQFRTEKLLKFLFGFHDVSGRDPSHSDSDVRLRRPRTVRAPGIPATRQKDSTGNTGSCCCSPSRRR